jgi:hypothetical protein
MPSTPPLYGYRTALAIWVTVWVTVWATLLAALATGCASPGPPHPPSLELPKPVTDLTAQRIGYQVVLHWTTPNKTTENLVLPGKVAANLSAHICRRPASASKSAWTCTSVFRIPVQPGPSTAADTLPTSLTADPVSLLDYRVEIENPAGRTAGPSNSVLITAGAAPPPVQNLRATTIPTGVMLEWQPATAATDPATAATHVESVELDRTTNTPKPSAPPVITTRTPGPAAPATGKSNKGSKSSSRSSPIRRSTKPGKPMQLAGQEPSEVHLRATPATTGAQPSAPDPNREPNRDSGGTIDQTARVGETYSYAAQRVRSIPIGPTTYEIRSPLSAAVTLTLRDTFPPAPPRGLDGIPTQTPAPAIDLSWEPNTEHDLAGYLVYRQLLDDSGAPTGPPTRITPKPLPGPAFSDTTAIPGQRYIYTVTAIDTSGNESKPSPEIEESLH